ncbi:hypothetical protein J6590_097276, partial [Homalodisca vitripennis]
VKRMKSLFTQDAPHFVSRQTSAIRNSPRTSTRATMNMLNHLKFIVNAMMCLPKTKLLEMIHSVLKTETLKKRFSRSESALQEIFPDIQRRAASAFPLVYP